MEKLLELFVDKKSSNKKCQEPFYNPLYNEVWATDRHILMTIKGYHSNNILALKKPDFDGERIAENIKIDDLVKRLQRIKLVDEVEREACEECGGSGEVTWRYMSFTNIKDRQWINYLRLYRANEDSFMVCNAYDELLEWRLMKEENLQKEYLCCKN